MLENFLSLICIIEFWELSYLYHNQGDVQYCTCGAASKELLDLFRLYKHTDVLFQIKHGCNGKWNWDLEWGNAFKVKTII